MTAHRRNVRSVLLGATALAGAITLAVTPAAAQQERYDFNLPAQPLETALEDYARTAKQQLIFADTDVRGLKAPAVSGTYSPDEALQRLLAGTELKVRRTASGVVQISADAVPQGGSADDSSAVEALIVTAQKKEEAIQDVPIAISAFSQESLDAQKLEGGFDLLKAIPNVTFSKNNFSGYNFSIRGVGTKAVSASTDPGVAVSFNNTTLIVNRLFEQEYFDVERVEVLRGPQGTLFGRNATSGVINVISARPRMGEFSGELELEAGNFNAQRVRGMLNVPIGDTFAVRLAGAMTKREGFGTNLAAGTAGDLNGVSADVDDRDLWSTRVTVGWEPTDAVRANLLWEHFEEDDSRVRTSKQLCHHDPGPRYIGSFDWETEAPFALSERAAFSQGCLPGSLYDTGSVSDLGVDAGEAHGAFGTPNGASLPFISGLFWGGVFGPAGGEFGLGHSPYWLQPTAPCEAAAQFQDILPLNPCQPDPYGRLGQSRDLREIHSLLQPVYRAKADVFELAIDIDVTEWLTFTSQTVFNRDEYYATQDFNRFTTLPVFNDSSIACANPQFIVIEDGEPPIFIGEGSGFEVPCQPGEYDGGHYNVTPGGFFDDPQLGRSNTLVAQDLSQAESEQFNQEFRLASNYETPFNFSLGANFTKFETWNDYYVFANALTLLTHMYPFNTSDQDCDAPVHGCVYVDRSAGGVEGINGEGHNYFRSANPYELTSSALFGELYWQATDTLKFTVGARMTWDRKVFTPIPSQLLLSDYRIWVAEGAGPEACTTKGASCDLSGTAANGRGYPAEPPLIQEWREPTGRIIVDWKPDLGFTDETMIYASLAHGYKGGGANPPGIAAPAGILNAAASGVVAPATFEPEFVDALEFGAKNTLVGGALILNAALFYYDYEGYQVSKIVDRSAANENFDAKVWGAELEWIFSPTRNLRFNGAFGALRTEIGDGERSIDLMDRTLGGHHDSWVGLNGVTHALPYDEWVLVKPWVTSSSNCVLPVALAELLIRDNLNQTINACPGGGVLGATINDIRDIGVTYDPTTEAPNGGAGFFTELEGHELPNAPHWTASLGGQYRFALPGGWDGTVRGDFYWQSQSFARVYNTQYDKLRAWTNTNISLWFEQPDWGVTAEVYVKNVFDETPITDAFLNSDDSGLTTNVFTLDPRLVGVSLRKRF